MTLTGTTTAGQSGTGSNGNERVLYIPKHLELMSHHQIQFGIISGHSLEGFLSLQRCSQCVLQTMTTLPRSPKLGPHHWMLFSDIPEAPFFGGGYLIPLQGYSQHILNSNSRVISSGT